MPTRPEIALPDGCTDASDWLEDNVILAHHRVELEIEKLIKEHPGAAAQWWGSWVDAEVYESAWRVEHVKLHVEGHRVYFTWPGTAERERIADFWGHGDALRLVW